MKAIFLRILATLLACGLAQTGSARAAPPALRVVVTIHPLELLIQEVGGERVEIRSLVPPGASPHLFETKPSDLVAVAKADLFLRIGGGLDSWAGRILATATDSRHDAVPSLLDWIGMKLPDHADHHSDPDASALHSAGQSFEPGSDPHVWLDPILVADRIVPALVRALADLDPAGAKIYRDRGAVFRDQLKNLDREIRDRVRPTGRRYVAFHNAWRHFAKRYELIEIAVVQEFAGEEPTPRELANMVRAARTASIPAILVEPQLDHRVARTLASEFGGITVMVDPLGDPESQERSTYGGLMRFNALAFVRAMSEIDTHYRPLWQEANR